MFGMSGTELAIVLIVALLFLGPTKLPELARSLGKGLRELRRTTDDLKASVESEFYRMDQPPPPAAPEPNPSLPGPDPAAGPAELPSSKPTGEASEIGEERKQ